MKSMLIFICFVSMASCLSVPPPNVTTWNVSAPVIGQSFKILTTQQPSDSDQISRANSQKIALLTTEQIAAALTTKGFVDAGSADPDFIVSFLWDMEVSRTVIEMYSLRLSFSRVEATVEEVRSGNDRLWYAYARRCFFSGGWFSDESMEESFARAFRGKMSLLLREMLDGYPSDRSFAFKMPRE
jgi:hypothetical protein